MPAERRRSSRFPRQSATFLAFSCPRFAARWTSGHQCLYLESGHEQLYSVSRCFECVSVNVCVSGTPACLWSSPVGHFLDPVLPTPRLRSCPPPFLGFITLIAEPGYPPPTPETALTSFCMAQGHKWSLMMLSEALSGVWTTAEPDPCTPQAVPTAGTPRLRSARPAVARSQPDLRSHHPTIVQTLGY